MRPQIKSKQKLSTPAGISINEIALRLKSADPSLSFKNANKKAKEIKTAQETVQTGGKIKGKILTSVLGNNLGGMAARALTSKSKLEAAAKTLNENKEIINPEKKTTQILSSISTRLESIEKSVKEIKTQKLAPASVTEHTAPKMTMADHRKNKTEAMQGLSFLGFKKGEAQAMMEGAPAGLSTEELIKWAMSKNKHAEAAEKIPLANVHTEIDKASESMRASQVQPEAPRPPPAAIPNDVKSDKDQMDAKHWKALLDEQKDRKETKSTLQEILADLEQLKKSARRGGLLDLVSKLLESIGKNIFKVLWWVAKQVVKGVLKGVKFLGKEASKIFKKMFGKDTEKAAGKIAEKAGAKIGEKELAKIGEEEATKAGEKTVAKVAGKTLGKSLLKKLPLIGAAVGLGFAAQRLGEGDVTGAALEAGSGLLSTLPGLGTAASFGVDAVIAGRDLKKAAEATPDKTKQAADNIKTGAEDSDDLDDNDDQPPAPIVMQDNRKIDASGNDDMPPIIKVRNDEPSMSSMIAEIFDHPVSYAGIFRM